MLIPLPWPMGERREEPRVCQDGGLQRPVGGGLIFFLALDAPGPPSWWMLCCVCLCLSQASQARK